MRGSVRCPYVPLPAPERNVADDTKEDPAEVAAEWGSERRVLWPRGALCLALRGLSIRQADALGDLDAGCGLGTAEPMTVSIRRGTNAHRDKLVVDRIVALRWVAREDELEIAGRYFFASVVRAPSGKFRASLWTFWESPAEFNDAISNFTRVALALGWTSDRRLLVHSCAVVGPTGCVGLFFGHSGAGKSTLGSIAARAGRQVLSDDLNAVDLGDPRTAWVQGFPWSGDHGPRSWNDIRSGRLGAIFQLEKGPQNAVTPLGKARAAAGLAACSPFINGEPALFERLFPVVEDLVRRVPTFKLEFRMDEQLWALVDRAVPGDE